MAAASYHNLNVCDPNTASALVGELRVAMRRLLFELCRDLQAHYPRAVRAFRLPLGFFRDAARRLPPEAYSGWKVAGWVEDLNDLVYFIDLREQWRREKARRAFADALWVECQDRLYENRFLDDLFPRGEPHTAGLARRLESLCARLARGVTMESLFLVPGLPCAWLGRVRRSDSEAFRTLPFDLQPNFERAEQAGGIPVGWEGGSLVAPTALRRRLSRLPRSGRLHVTPVGIQVRLEGATWPVLSLDDRGVRWHWRYVPPCKVRPAGPLRPDPLTLGPALQYRGVEPCRVGRAPADSVRRLQAALSVIELVWPEGARLFRCLTTRIVPLKARGVVSFSYRHRPGLSFINMYERNDLDLVDDLLHENSHHHLNLLLRKSRLRRGDRQREIFYSPWRRSLRPLHGILHATFTFTVGAVLFERISSYAAKHGGRVSLGRGAGLGPREVLRARYRCLEEVESVRYSLEDLSDAAHRLGWLTSSGVTLVQALRRDINRVARRIAPFRNQVLRSKYGPALRRHIQALEEARKMYGRPLRVSGSGKPRDLKRRVG